MWKRMYIRHWKASIECCCCCCCFAHIVSRGWVRSMWPPMHSQVCAEAQRGTGTGFINKPNKGRCCQWPLRCGFGSAGKADVYPEETNKALSCQLGGESAQNSIIREKRHSDHVSEGRWPPRCIHTSIRDHRAAVCSNRRFSTFFYCTYTCDLTHNCHGDQREEEKKNIYQLPFVG